MARADLLRDGWLAINTRDRHSERADGCPLDAELSWNGMTWPCDILVPHVVLNLLGGPRSSPSRGYKCCICRVWHAASQLCELVCLLWMPV